MSVHVSRDRPYKATNPDLPTLQPWMNVTFPPAERFIFERNPYYHRVDQNGRQLPYIDSIADQHRLERSGAGQDRRR